MLTLSEFRHNVGTWNSVDIKLGFGNDTGLYS